MIFSSQNEWNVQYSTWSPETLAQGDLVSRSLLPRFQFMPTRHSEVPGCGCSLWLPLTELLAPAGFGCKFYPRLIYSSVPFSPNESYPCCQSKSRKKKKTIDFRKNYKVKKNSLQYRSGFVIKYPFQKTVRTRQGNGQFVLHASITSKARAHTGHPCAPSLSTSPDHRPSLRMNPSREGRFLSLH